MVVGPSRLVRMVGPVSLLLGLALSIGWPPPTPRDYASVTRFELDRAMAHVRAIAREPHPVGSVAHRAVRDYILQELRRLPVEVSEQSANVTTHLAGHTTGATIHNIACRISGRVAHRQAIMLAAHYDSVDGSPGASDDSAAVGALLETARVLVHQPTLQRDVVLLFVDGEELGLLGAEGFMRENPLAKEIGLVVNFEARGSRGNVLLFQISPNQGALLDQFGLSVHFPRANSLFTTLSTLLPNDTDVTAYDPKIPRVLGFAFAEGLEHYHRPTDTVANLDVRSLAQIGANAIGLARHFGELDELPPKETDAVYFDLWGRWLVRYSSHWSRLLALLCAVGWIWLVRSCLRVCLVTRSGLRLGAKIVGSTLAFGIAVPVLFGALSAALLGEVPWIESSPWVGFASLLVAAGAGMRLHCLALRQAHPRELGLGALGIGVVLACVFGWSLPGMSAIWQWPVVIWLLAWAAEIRIPLTSISARKWLFSIPIFLDVLLVAPALASALGLAGPVLIFLPVVIGVAEWAFILPALVPEEAVSSRAWGWSVVAAGLGIFSLGTGATWASARFRSKSEVVAPNHATDGDASTYHASLALPEFLVQAVSRSETSRTFDVRIVPTRQARCVFLKEVRGPRLVPLSVNGYPVIHLVRFSPEIDELGMRLFTGGAWSQASEFTYCGMQGEPLVLRLQLPGKEPVELRLMAQFDESPEPASERPEKKPEGARVLDDLGRSRRVVLE
jgi:hypothetical protein